MTIPKRYPFDNEQLSITAISKRYPAYSWTAIQHAVQEGCKSLADLQARDARCRAAIAKAQTKNARSMPPLLGMGLRS